MTTQSDHLSLTDEQQKLLLQIARHALAAHFAHRPLPDPAPNDVVLWQQVGIFVTLWLHDDTQPPAYWPQGHLRGCVGHIQSDLPLYQAVAKTAVEAATADPRFSPLSEEELAVIHIEISLLSPLHPVKQLEQIEIGVHGLLISNGIQRGLLLPQVAVNRQWNQQQFFKAVCKKAELPRRVWPRAAKLFAFTTIEFEEPHPTC